MSAPHVVVGWCDGAVAVAVGAEIGGRSAASGVSPQNVVCCVDLAVLIEVARQRGDFVVSKVDVASHLIRVYRDRVGRMTFNPTLLLYFSHRVVAGDQITDDVIAIGIGRRRGLAVVPYSVSIGID